MTARKLWLCHVAGLLVLGSRTWAAGGCFGPIQICFNGLQMYEDGDHGGWGKPGAAIDCPQWQSWPLPTRSKPICYIKNTSVGMDVTLMYSPPPQQPRHGEVWVQGFGYGLFDELSGTAEFDFDVDQETTEVSISLSPALENMIYMPDPSLEWQVRWWDPVEEEWGEFQAVEGCGECVPLAPIYVVWGTPMPASALSECRIAECVGAANRKTTEIGAGDGTHMPLYQQGFLDAHFEGRHPRRVVNYGTDPPSDPAPGNPDHDDVNWYLFSPEDTGWKIKGACDVFAFVHKNMLDLLGVTGSSAVYIFPADWSKGHCPPEQAHSFPLPEHIRDLYGVCKSEWVLRLLQYCSGCCSVNSYEGTCKLVAPGETKYYGGAVSCEGGKAITILRCVAAAPGFQYWTMDAVACRQCVCGTTCADVPKDGDWADPRGLPVPLPPEEACP